MTYHNTNNQVPTSNNTTTGTCPATTIDNNAINIKDEYIPLLFTTMPESVVECLDMPSAQNLFNNATQSNLSLTTPGLFEQDSSMMHTSTTASMSTFTSMAPQPNVNIMPTPPPDDQEYHDKTHVTSLCTLLSHFPDLSKYLGHEQFGNFINHWYTFQYCIALARFDHLRPMVIQEMKTLVSHLNQLVNDILQQQNQFEHENLEQQTSFMICAIQTLKDRVENVIQVFHVIEKGCVDPMRTITSIVQGVLKRRESRQEEKAGPFLLQQYYQPPVQQQQQQQDFNMFVTTTYDNGLKNMTTQTNQNTTVMSETSFAPISSSSSSSMLQNYNNHGGGVFCIQPIELMQFPQEQLTFSTDQTLNTMLPQLSTEYNSNAQYDDAFVSNMTTSSLPSGVTPSCQVLSVVDLKKHDQTIESLSQSVVDIDLKECKSNNKKKEDQDIQVKKEKQSEQEYEESDDDEYENDDDVNDEDYEEENVIESEDEEMMDLDQSDEEDDDQGDEDYIDRRVSTTTSNNNKKKRAGRPPKKVTHDKSNNSTLKHQKEQQQQQRRTRAPRQYTRRTATSYDADTTHYLKSVFFSIYSKRDKLTKEQRKQVQVHTGLKPRNITYWFSNHKRRFQNSLQVFKQAVRESQGKVKTYDDFLVWRRNQGLSEDLLESDMTVEHFKSITSLPSPSEETEKAEKEDSN